MINLILVSILVYLINIPFGYWRSNVKKLSLQWILAIHIPVPFIVGLRIVSGIGFGWYTYVILVAAYFMGQKTGSIIINRIRRVCERTSSCLIMDLYRCIHF